MQKDYFEFFKEFIKQNFEDYEIVVVDDGSMIKLETF